MVRKSQEHYLQIQKRLLQKMVERDLEKRQRLQKMTHAVARDAYYARTGVRAPPTIRQSYSRGIMTFGVSHVRTVCRDILQRYAPPTIPLVSVGCGDARIEEDLLKDSPRSFYLVDPDPSAFMGRNPFLPVHYSSVQQLPRLSHCILCIFWPEPATEDLSYDRLALDTLEWDILITIFTHDGTSGSDAFVEKVNHLCNAPRWYTVLHDEWKQYDYIHIRFVILIRNRVKTEGDIRAYTKQAEVITALRRKYPQIDAWKKTVRSKIVLMKPDEHIPFYTKMTAQVRRFCERESILSDDCRMIIDFLI